MPNKNDDMLTIRQLIRLKLQGCSHKSITKQLRISRTTVIDYVRQLEASGLSWSQLDKIDDAALAVILGAGIEINDRYRRLLNSFPYMEKELKRRGVTRQLLWKEYKADEAEPYAYSQFCYHYQQWNCAVHATAPMPHKIGDKLFVDFSGGKLPVIDAQSGEITEVEVFAAVLGASGLTYAQVVYSQKQEDVVSCIEQCLDFYGVVPNVMMSWWSVPDKSTSEIMSLFNKQLKKGVGKADALRNAKLQYLQTADINTSDPYYWAAFTLIGDNEPILVKTSTNMWFLLAAMIVMISFVIIRMRK